MRDRILTAVAAAFVVPVAMAVTYLIPSVAERTTASWGDLSAVGFGIALLLAWGLGSLAFTSKQRRHRT